MASLDTTALVSTKGGTDEEEWKGGEGQREGQKLVVARSSGSGGGEDKEGKKDDGGVKGSASDKLPDEVLVLILRDALGEREGPLLDLITISNRFFRLVWSEWMSRQHNTNGDLHHLVHRPADRSLLTSLSLDFDQDFLPLDKMFTIGTDLPQLQKLHLGPYSLCGPQLFSDPSPNLQSLDFNLQDDAELALLRLPWSSLVSLSLYTARGDGGRIRFSRIVDSLNDHVSLLFTRPLQWVGEVDLTPLNLADHRRRHSSARIPVLHGLHLRGREGPSVTAGAESTAVSVLSHTTVKQLYFRANTSLLPPSSSYSLLPLVTSVLLTSQHLTMVEPGNFSALVQHLAAFPNLERLTLDVPQFSTSAPSSAESQRFNPCSDAFIAAHPHLFALLAILRTKPVLYFAWKNPTERYVWTRARRDEDFQTNVGRLICSSPADLVVAVSSGSGGGEAKEGKEDDRGVKDSPFDKLPDELLQHILAKILEDRRREGLLIMTVNKRFLRLARPQWYREVDFDSANGRILQLILHPRERELVHSFTCRPTSVDESCRLYEYAVVSLLPNLTTLRVHTAETEFPTAMSDALRQCKHLVELAIYSDEYWSFEDDDWSFGKDLPQLRRLDLGPFCLSYTRLSPVSPHHLSTSNSSTMLTSLTRPNSCTFSSQPFPLRRLVLPAAAFMMFQSHVPTPWPRASSEDYTKLFLALSQSPIETLEMGISLEHVPKLCSFPHVKSLVLCIEEHYGTPYIVTPRDLLGLDEVLTAFVNLDTLILEDFHFADEQTMQASSNLAPNSPTFLLHFPSLAALLPTVHRSGLLQFTWISHELSYVWDRSSREEDFEVERFRPF
ncbi:hypothetical protein JCM8547_002938 [Rhodosporidiobolus lusitaniae]